MNGEKVEHNSDILFVYEAKMCNPNGDPDDENRPRMDYISNRNLVSDVRLKGTYGITCRLTKEKRSLSPKLWIKALKPRKDSKAL